MSTLTVAVATFSVNTLKIIVVNIYTESYSVDTHGCSSNAYGKHIENYSCYLNTKNYRVDTHSCSSNA